MKADTGAPDATLRAKQRIAGNSPVPPTQRGELLAAPNAEYEVVSTGSPRRDKLGARQLQGWRGTLLRGGTAALAIVLLVLIWWAVAVLGNYPSFILPTPDEVGKKLWSLVAGSSGYGSLYKHAWTTVLEAGLGFLLAFAVGTSLGYVIAHSHALERFLSPYIAVSQGLPVVALAPLLAIWFSDNLLRNIVVVALIVFFPILVNTVVAVRNIDRSMYEVARIEGASFLQTVWYVELPLGLRAMLGGVKLGLTLAITGAVIGEFISAGSGLGYLLMAGRGQFDTAMVFAGLVSLATLTIITYTGMTVLERVLITWE